MSIVICDTTPTNLPPLWDILKCEYIMTDSFHNNSDIDSFISTHRDKLLNLNTLGFMYDNNGQFRMFNGLASSTYFPEHFVYFLRKLQELSPAVIIDFITCNINTPPHIERIKQIEEDLKINIRYSIDETGMPSNWVMESDKTDIKDIYFTEKINDTSFTLGGSGAAYFSAYVDNSGNYWRAGKWTDLPQLSGYVAYEGNDISSIATYPGGDGGWFLIKTDGTAYYQGSGQYHSGLGHTNNVPTLTQITSLSGVSKIHGSYDNIIALMGDGTIRTWGYNSYGQLGNASTTHSSSPITPTLPSFTGSIVDVVASRGISAFLLDNGDVYCCGHTQSNTFTKLSTVSNVTKMIAFHTSSGIAFLDSSGVVKYIGTINGGVSSTTTGIANIFTHLNNYYYQLTNGTILNLNTSDTGLYNISTGASKQILNIVATENSGRLALLSDGTCVVIGGNSNGEYADGTTTTSSTWKAQGSFTNVQQVEAFYYTGYAVRTSTQVILTGSKAAHIKFLPNEFVKIDYFSNLNIKQIAHGQYHSAVLTHDGEVHVYNTNSYVSNSQFSFVHLSDFPAIERIACTDHTVYGLTSDGNFYGCGWDQEIGVPGVYRQVRQVGGSEFGINVVKIKTGNQGAVIQKSDGSLYSIGARHFQYSSVFRPSRITCIPADKTVDDYFIGQTYVGSFIKFTDGTWLRYGTEYYGDTKYYIDTNFDIDSSFKNTTGSPISNIIIGGGGYFITQNNTICRVGSVGYSNRSTVVVSDSNINGSHIVATGGDHLLAYKNGNIYGVGRNNGGEFGNGNTTNSYSSFILAKAEPNFAFSTNDFYVYPNLNPITQSYWIDIATTSSVLYAQPTSGKYLAENFILHGLPLTTDLSSSYVTWNNSNVGIIIDTGSEKTLDYMTIYMKQYMPTSLSISYSTDNSTWSNTSYNNINPYFFNTPSHKTLELGGITARYIKITTPTSSGLIVTIAQIGLFSPVNLTDHTTYQNTNTGIGTEITDTTTGLKYKKFYFNGQLSSLITGPDHANNLAVPYKTNINIPSTLGGYDVVGMLGRSLVNTSATSMSLPSTLKFIAGPSFSNHSTDTSGVTIPQSVEYIGGANDYSFHNLSNITEFSILNPDVEIGTNLAFYYLNKVQNATIYLPDKTKLNFNNLGASASTYGTITLSPNLYSDSALKTLLEGKGYTVAQATNLPVNNNPTPVWKADPLNTNSYSGSGGNLYNTYGMSSGTMQGVSTFNSANLGIRLTGGLLTPSMKMKTIAFWVKFVDFGNDGYVLDARSGGSGYVIFRNSSNYSFSGFDSTVYINSNATTFTNGTELITTHLQKDTWYHLVFTSTSQFTDDLRILDYYASTGGSVDAYLGPVDIFDTAISQTAVINLYNRDAERYSLPLNEGLVSYGGLTTRDISNRVLSIPEPDYRDYIVFDSTSLQSTLPTAGNDSASEKRSLLRQSIRNLKSITSLSGSRKLQIDTSLLSFSDIITSQTVTVVADNTEHNIYDFRNKALYATIDNVNDYVQVTTGISGNYLRITKSSDTTYLVSESGVENTRDEGYSALYDGLTYELGSVTIQPDIYVPCFAAGTLIHTPNGPVPIENIKDGDLIYTNNRQLQPATLHSRTIYETDSNTAPYVIKQHAIGHNLPSRDTIVSPHHAIYMSNGHFTFAPALAKMSNKVYQLPIGKEQIYYNIETPDYANTIMFANGLPVEPMAGQKIRSEYKIFYNNDDSNVLYKRYIIHKSLITRKLLK